MQKIIVRIETIAPVIFSTRADDNLLTATKDYFSGKVILGALAKRMIRQQDWGENAHLQDDFVSIFLSGAVKFLPAYPEFQGEKTAILPLSLQKNKEGTKIIDLAFGLDAAQAGFKAVKGFALLADGCCLPVEVDKNITLHIARENESERISGKSIDGGVFSLESIDRGQIFQGEIIGEAEALTRLLGLLQLDDGQFTAYFGRSKYTQYGKCNVTLSSAMPLEREDIAAAIVDDTVFLRCETPFLPYDNAGRSDKALVECIESLVAHDGEASYQIKRENIFAAWEDIENFVAVWGLKRPRESAISAGSVFGVTRSAPWTKEAVMKLSHCLYGEGCKRGEEGFGQLRPWPRQSLVFRKADDKSAKKVPLCGEVKRVAGKIIMRYILENMRKLAREDAKRVQSLLKGKKHLFARLENILGEKECAVAGKKEFTMKICAEIREKSQAEQHLRQIHLQGKDLLTILKEGTAPYEGKIQWQEKLPDGLTQLAGEIGVTLPGLDHWEIYHEYWQWFFRHARKFASGGKENE